MIECLILGDSIAVGVSQVRKECVAYAKSGWNSMSWNKDYLNQASKQSAKTVIISLGANDYKGIKTEEELRKMRQSISGTKVFWIDAGKSRKPIPHDVIVRIASEYGDTIIPRPKDHMSADGVHPTYKGYKILGEQTK